VADDDASFLSRWARRKAAVREGAVLPEPAPAVAPPPAMPPPLPAAVAHVEPAAAPKVEPPPPTLEDVAGLTSESDFTRFVARGVEPDVKNAALKKLFADPQFNVMDGLDIYIDDYGKPDPIPAHWLKQMVQSKALGLFDDEPETQAETEADAAKRDAAPSPLTAEPPASEAKRHEDTDLQLQPDDDAGRTGPEPGVEQDPGRDH
jgi:hypothetical protein